MNITINELLDYALHHNMITQYDVEYCANRLIDLLKIDEFKREITGFKKESCVSLLEVLLDYAVKIEIIDNEITARDLFDTRIMDCIMKRPGEVVNEFNNLYKNSPVDATDYFYKLSIASNYIRKSRTDQNIVFDTTTKYGKCIISINLSKPEKDPKMIAKLATMASSSYPTCLLCKENVGYAGDLQKNARQTHRIIPFKLGEEDFYLQYSPYVYYNEHCIIFNKKHTPMTINHETFKQLLQFTDQFPHYMIGSNADLPIVGGSILSHAHYQGGCFDFPIYDAKVIENYNINNVDVSILSWPLSTVRLQSNNFDQILSLSNLIFDNWLNYSDESVHIISHSNDVRHNTITPIVRKINGLYSVDLVLRNNRTNDKYPLGIFHPHEDVHHIKKENIGLIEVMGLAILPARLKDEIQLIKECLVNGSNFDSFESLKQHENWFNYLKTLDINESNVDEILQQEIGSKFERVLEDAGVFKMDEIGIEAFKRFINSL